MKIITYEVWAKPNNKVSDETKRLFRWYNEVAKQLKLNTMIADYDEHIELIVNIEHEEDLQKYDTLYRDYICHPERSEYYE